MESKPCELPTCEIIKNINLAIDVNMGGVCSLFTGTDQWSKFFQTHNYAVKRFHAKLFFCFRESLALKIQELGQVKIRHFFCLVEYVQGIITNNPPYFFGEKTNYALFSFGI